MREALSEAYHQAQLEERKARFRALEGQTGEAAREWWRATAEVLRTYRLLIADPLPPGRSPPSYPGEVFLALEQIANDLALGVTLQVIKSVSKKGAPPRPALERRDLQFAVAYLQAAKKGGLEHQGQQICIDDPAAIKTIMGWYGAERETTVRGWLKDPTLLAGDHLGPLDMDVLPGLARTAGGRFKRMGKGHAAVAARARKRNE